ncbi:hypothetical protein [Nostoc sp.]
MAGRFEGLSDLVVRQPKIAGWMSAEEQGSRGEAYTKFFPLCPSAPLLTTMQSFLGRLLVLCQANFAG